MFVRYGFEVEDIIPLEYSATSVIQDNRKNALKTDGRVYVLAGMMADKAVENSLKNIMSFYV